MPYCKSSINTVAIIVFVTLFIIVNNCYCMPFIDDENVIPIGKDVNCYGHVCPDDTVYCKKIMKTSGDKKSYETSIYCVGNRHAIVDQKHFLTENPNPNGPRMKMISMNGKVLVNVNNIRDV